MVAAEQEDTQICSQQTTKWLCKACKTLLLSISFHNAAQLPLYKAIIKTGTSSHLQGGQHTSYI